LFLELKKEKIRIELNTSNETMQTKIRKSQLAKIPYMLIIGEKEIKTNSVSLRNRDGQELGLIRIDEFIDKLNSEINIEKKVIV
jgi:threonyl-tRNA synthetase